MNGTKINEKEINGTKVNRTKINGLKITVQKINNFKCTTAPKSTVTEDERYQNIQNETNELIKMKRIEQKSA